MRDTIEAPNAGQEGTRRGAETKVARAGRNAYLFLSGLLPESSPEESLGCHFVSAHSGFGGQTMQNKRRNKEQLRGQTMN